MEPKTYRVTASVGSWRSLPWPFGLLDVTDTGLRVHSWHWSWWVRDQTVAKESIYSIQVINGFGQKRLVVHRRDAPPVKLLPTRTPEVINDLQLRGYVVDPLE